jgi:hypothetical protein
MGTIANAQDNPPASPVEVREATDSFHKSVIQAAVKAQRAGTLKRLDVVRLRVAMLSPAFRNHAQDLAVVQMSASGSETTPIGEDGQVDRASIDWAGLAAFLEKLLPLILQLIDAFSSFQNGEVLIFDPFQIRGPPAIELYC